MNENPIADQLYSVYLAGGGDPDSFDEWRRKIQEVEAAARERATQSADAARKEWEERKRVLDQRSGAEVPGFHARTVCDDTIGKLYALRCSLKTPIPEGLAGLLDDIEEKVEQAIDLAYDPDASEVTDDAIVPGLLNSGSDCVSWCSCGGERISPPDLDR